MIKDLARKELGQEEKVVRRKDSTYIYYKNYYVVVNPQSIFVILNSNHRTVQIWDLNKENNLEKIFAVIEITAEQINKGKIK